MAVLFANMLVLFFWHFMFIFAYKIRCQRMQNLFPSIFRLHAKSCLCSPVDSSSQAILRNDHKMDHSYIRAMTYEHAYYLSKIIKIVVIHRIFGTTLNALRGILEEFIRNFVMPIHFY